MSFTEFIIIYLSLGAPLAVYYFFQNRNRLEIKQLWLKTILNFVFWLPSAFRLFKNYLQKDALKLNFDSFGNSDSADKKLSELKRKLENSIVENENNSTLFEIREIIDRYAGLTLEKENSVQINLSVENEFFKISEKNNAEIAALCEQRRNLKRLRFHQKLASEDFFELFTEVFYRKKFSPQIYSIVLEFTEFLQDFEMQKRIEKMFAQELQTSENLRVKQRENDLWITEQPKPLNTGTLSMSFQTMKATTNLQTKD